MDRTDAYPDQFNYGATHSWAVRYTVHLGWYLAVPVFFSDSDPSFGRIPPLDTNFDN